MRRLCTICARGGSKGVEGKNAKKLLGIPLIAYSIRQAQVSGLFDVIAVSSDSEEILKISKEYGVEYLIKRPDELATDEAAKLPAIKHCVDEVEKSGGQLFDIIVDLDATSPLRAVSDIQNAVALCEQSKAANVITAAPARRSPYFNLVELTKRGTVTLSKPLDTPVVRRQDAPKCYDMNASVYVWSRAGFVENATIFNEGTRLYVMPEERSIDIDTELDFKFVEFLMRLHSSESR
jgi:N-acylneuraminate cytidylyltransferase/CMP-N,N'-diacetyllegionaminic acid synthase